MKVENKSKRAFQHGHYLLNPGEIKEVPAEVAEIWLKLTADAKDKVIEYVAPADAKALEEQNKKLQAELAEIKKANKAKTSKKK